MLETIVIFACAWSLGRGSSLLGVAIAKACMPKLKAFSPMRPDEERGVMLVLSSVLTLIICVPLLFALMENI